MKYGLLTKRHHQRENVQKHKNLPYESILTQKSDPYVSRLLDYQGLYAGGSKFEERIKNFILPAAQDNDESYARKLKEAKTQHVNYFAQVINYYSGYLFSHQIEMQSDSRASEFWAEFKEDCDGNGLDFHDFLKERFIHALVSKHAVCVVQLPDLDIEPKTRLEWELSNAGRATIESFSAQEIYDYERDATGALEWMILGRCEQKRTNPHIDSEIITETFWLYDNENVEIYSTAYESNKKPHPNDDIPKIASYKHGFPRIPIIELCLDDGLWIGDKIASPQVANLKARTKRAWLNNNQAYSVPIIFSNDEESSALLKTGDCLRLRQDDKFEYTTPPAESAAALKEEIDDTRTAVFSAANMDHMAGTHNAKPWRSGLSVMLDQNMGLITLKSYGAYVRNFAEKIYNIIAEAREENIKWSAGGFEFLDRQDFDKLSSTLETLAKAGINPILSSISPKFHKELNKRIVALALPDLSEQIKEEIRKEIDLSNPPKEESNKPTKVVGTSKTEHDVN